VRAKLIRSMLKLYLPRRQPQNLMTIVSKSLNINGFIIFRLRHKYEDEFYATVPAKLASGEFKYTEEVTKGLENVGDVILAVQKGTNKAKAVISVAEE
jgi:NADPH-dependent curcumin reductase CurA